MTNTVDAKKSHCWKKLCNDDCPFGGPLCEKNLHRCYKKRPCPKHFLKKTFAITMFGSTFDWMQQFVDHVQHLGQYGWEWIIFTPNTDIQTKGNVRIVPMDVEQFNDLVEKKLGVRPQMGLTKKGTPSVHVTDFYVFSGLIFEDYLKESDFWGITNLDVVYGRPDHFIPDVLLENADIFTDDVNTINGVFSLYRNKKEVNELCLEIPHWKEKIAQEPCKKCTGEADLPSHMLYGTDEYDMTDVMRRPDILEKIRYVYPQRNPLHTHDRLEQHIPDAKLKFEEDGSLWELFRDIGAPAWLHSRPFFQREVMYYHFNKTKQWPKCLLK